MKKSIYFKLKIESQSDMQDYVNVSLSSARLAIFDFKSLDFVLYVIKQLMYSAFNDKAEYPMNYHLLINVSSFGYVVVNLVSDKGNTIIDGKLSDFVSGYVRMVTKSPFQKFDVPDVLVFLSYFLTEKQRNFCGLKYV